MCAFYNIPIDIIAVSGRERPASEARAAAALLVQENDNLKLTTLGNYLKRDLSTLSQAANRLRKRATNDKILRAKIESIRKTL